MQARRRTRGTRGPVTTSACCSTRGPTRSRSTPRPSASPSSSNAPPASAAISPDGTRSPNVRGRPAGGAGRHPGAPPCRGRATTDGLCGPDGRRRSGGGEPSIGGGVPEAACPVINGRRPLTCPCPNRRPPSTSDWPTAPAPSRRLEEVGAVSRRTGLGNRPRGLQRGGECLGLFPPRPRPQPGLPVE